MKKLAIVLSLVMVLAFGASVMAAEVKTSGKAVLSWSGVNDDGATLAEWDNLVRVQFDGKVSDNAGWQVRFDNDPVATTPVALKRANYWVNVPGLGKVTAGLQGAVNYTALDVFTSKLDIGDGSARFEGISIAPVLPEGFKAAGYVKITNAIDASVFGFNASYDAKVVNVYGGMSKAQGDADARMVIGASAPVVKDLLSVYGEYATIGDGDANDFKYVGAELTAGGFDIYGEYDVDGEVFGIDAYKTIGGIEFNVSYTMNQNDETQNELGVATTLYF